MGSGATSSRTGRGFPTTATRARTTRRTSATTARATSARSCSSPRRGTRAHGMLRRGSREWGRSALDLRVFLLWCSALNRARSSARRFRLTTSSADSGQAKAGQWRLCRWGPWRIFLRDDDWQGADGSSGASAVEARCSFFSAIWSLSSVVLQEQPRMCSQAPSVDHGGRSECSISILHYLTILRFLGSTFSGLLFSAIFAGDGALPRIRRYTPVLPPAWAGASDFWLSARLGLTRSVSLAGVQPCPHEVRKLSATFHLGSSD